MGKINVYDKIVLKKEKKRKYGNRRNFIHKPPSRRRFWNGIYSVKFYSLLMRADARGSDDTIYCM